MSQEQVQEVVNEPVVSNEQVVEQKNDKETNLRKLAKKNEALERQNAEMSQKMNEMYSMIEQINRNSSQQQRVEPSVYEKYGMEPGGIVETDKFVTAIQKEREEIKREFRKEAEEIVERTLDKRNKSSFADRLLNKYPDYDQVITEDTMEKLKEEEPEFVDSLSDMQDEYKRRELAYRKAKKLIERDSKKVAAPVVTSQEIVDKNKKANYAYSSAGSGIISSDFSWKDFYSNPDIQKKAYEKLKTMQGGQGNNPR